MIDKATKEQLNLHLYHEPTDRLLAKHIFEDCFPYWRVESTDQKLMIIDFLIFDRETGKFVGGLDVEKQTRFQGREYDTIRGVFSVEEKKNKYWKEYKDSFLIILSWDYSHYILLTGKEILAGKKIKLNKTSMGGKDYFMDVPKNQSRIESIPAWILSQKNILEVIKKTKKLEEKNFKLSKYHGIKTQVERFSIHKTTAPTKTHKTVLCQTDQMDLFL